MSSQFTESAPLAIRTPGSDRMLQTVTPTTYVPNMPRPMERPLAGADVTPSSEFVFACSYTAIDNLAHQPVGTPAKHALSMYSLDHETGRLTLLTLTNPKQDPNLEALQNPAFARCHPKKDVVYIVTESINDKGWLFALGVCPVTGKLRELGRVSTGGRSACYISLSYDLRYLLIVNYWDSTMVSVPIDENGLFSAGVEPVVNTIPGENADKERKSHGNDPHSKHRFAESHAHAVVFDPSYGCMVYIPDLGEGCVKQFLFNEVTGAIEFAGRLDCGGRESGPRYLEFHPTLNICYLVNELASNVMVYRYDEYRALELDEKYKTGRLDLDKLGDSMPTLLALQTISTIPEAFPKDLNTCGRICVDPSGKWVLVSNRGHDSIAVYKIALENVVPGTLKLAGFYHTQGHTPRHFRFSTNGKWLFAANQDSDNLAVFEFDRETGALSLKHRYPVSSPNFICNKVPFPARRQEYLNSFSRM